MPRISAKVQQPVDDPLNNLPPRTRKYLDEGVAVGGRNDELLAAACQFRDAGFTVDDAHGYLMPCAVRDGLSEAEARKTINSAYTREAREPLGGSGFQGPNGATPFDAKPREPSKPKTPPKAQPLPPPISDGFKVILETYFKEGEGVGISDTKLNANGEADPGPGDVFLREFWLKRLGRKPIDQIYPKARDGLFIRINPIAKNGKADKDITSFRHCLVEFDLDQAGNRIQKEVQYAALLESDLPISVVLDSGNKSIHGWVRIDAPDRAEYDRRRDIVWEYFEKAGLPLDSGNKNPSRYSRCPGVERNLYDKDGNLIGTGRQELLAVNVGAASWEKWEKAQQATQDECREYDREETARLLGEDRPFPAPMDETAYYGIAGEIVSIIAAGNEPCRESLLGHFLFAAGNMIGWNPWMDQGGDQHLNEFGLFIGPSSIGRKGTAWTLIKRLMSEVDQKWTTRRVRRALQSGEAIIHNIRDPSIKGGQRPYTDPGVADKRMVIMESEITRFLTVGKRRGNNLFDVTHDCWDSLDPLCCDSKTAAEEATHPHVSMIAHGTREAYLKELPESEKTNGSVNRSIILAVYRAKKKAKPARILWQRYHSDIIARLQAVLATFKIRRELDWSREALIEWEAFYDSFDSKTHGGMISSILDRLPTHVVRIAMIYCALDNCCLISTAHLKAAMAFCDYYRRSAEWLFGEKTGNARADRIYSALLRAKPDGMSRTEIAEIVFSKNIASAELDELLCLLVKAELIYLRSEPNPRKGPRYLQKWYAR